MLHDLLVIRGRASCFKMDEVSRWLRRRLSHSKERAAGTGDRSLRVLGVALAGVAA